MPVMNELLFFVLFLMFIGGMLTIDLGIFNKRTHQPSFKEAIGWTVLWVSISIGFYFFIRTHGNLIHGLDTLEALSVQIDLYRHPVSLHGITDFQEAVRLYNQNLGLEYLTGYLIEYSLSVDNVFVIIMFFISFNIHPDYYKKVLLWGILGALIMRFIFIFTASALIIHVFWTLAIFGGLLVILGGKMAYEFFTRENEDKIDTENHPVVRFASRWFSVTREDHGEKFWIRKEGKLFITPLFLVLLIIEFSDVLFAIDSVPAVFSVTRDPYIVFFSNIFAILGLRSLFFVLMHVVDRFTYLRLGLSALLIFVGVKMIMHTFGWWPLATNHSLMIILAILLVSVIMSLLANMYHRNKSNQSLP